MTLALLTLKSTGQDFSNCKVDFSLMKQKEKIDASDRGKEFVIIDGNFPNYTYDGGLNGDINPLKAELKSKLKDNEEFNKNNPFVIDSLKTKYDLALQDKAYLRLYWTEFTGELNKKEIKEFQSNNFIKAYLSEKEFFYCLYDQLMKESDGDVSGQVSETHRQLKNAVVNPNINTGAFDINSGVKIYIGNRIYKVNNKVIPRYDPFFVIGNIDTTLGASLNIKKEVVSANSDENYIAFSYVPINRRPVFELSELINSELTLENDGLMKFTSSNKSIYQLCNYFFNSININKSISLLFDKKRLDKINEFLKSITNDKLVIETTEGAFLNPKINSFKFNYSNLEVSFTADGKEYTKTFTPSAKHKHSIVNDQKKTSLSELNFIFPIYHQDCYNKTVQNFNNLKLNSDAINDPELKKKLMNSLVSSSEWLGYKADKVILTNQTQWFVETNKWTGLKQSRYIYADVYFKNLKDGKCYLEKDVYFYQKLDPFNSVIYNLFCASPQTPIVYPCNLK